MLPALMSKDLVDHLAVLVSGDGTIGGAQVAKCNRTVSGICGGQSHPGIEPN